MRVKNTNGQGRNISGSVFLGSTSKSIKQVALNRKCCIYAAQMRKIVVDVIMLQGEACMHGLTTIDVVLRRIAQSFLLQFSCEFSITFKVDFVLVGNTVP
ncbi:MAG: hypothetical protein CMK04_13485 [Ponticaulis sp.]|nr:hypothetical protein [Ponticaulis sp.]